MTEFRVREDNVLAVPGDLLLLKYAQDFFGADAAAANTLASAGICAKDELRPAPGDFVLMETRGAMAPARVLFLGTPPLRSFTYDEMESFAQRAIQKIADLKVTAQAVTTTVHGSGYGLDGGEALQRLVRGFRKGLSEQPDALVGTLTFVTLSGREARMLTAALKALDSSPESLPQGFGGHDAERLRTIARTVGQQMSARVPESRPVSRKKRVFVALPFAEEFQNVYEFGIYPAVRNCGFICERVDETAFTGDILSRIRSGIESASLVIADLTEARPNVYLEVGYAWGRGIPVICIAKKGETLHFDVSTHRCVFYGKFSQFARDLEELIRGIEAPAASAEP